MYIVMVRDDAGGQAAAERIFEAGLQLKEVYTDLSIGVLAVGL